MKIIFLIIVIITVIIACTSYQREESTHIPQPSDLRQMAVDESLDPVRPGIPGQRPFWNTYAKRFIYAPAFEFEEIPDVDRYQMNAKVDATGQVFTYEAEKPWDNLSPVWDNLPVGKIIFYSTVKNRDRPDTIGVRDFYKAEPYSGPYARPSIGYRTSVRMLMNYLFQAPYVQHWLEEKKADPAYGLYGYPSKMYSAVIQGMLMFNETDAPFSRKDSALSIAGIVADRLMELSQPAGSPMEYFPPTYLGPIYADMLDEYRGESLADRIMLVYPAVAAHAYLDLYDYTKEKKYLEAAEKVAGTYKRLQLNNGSWHLLIYIANGEPVADNYLVPTGVISLMDRLKRDHEIGGYENCREKALYFIQVNLVAGYSWEGQFEDQQPSEKYKNLSKGQACSYALYLLENESHERDKLMEAEELIRFAEDQFVIWENPNPINSWGIKGDSWLTPCVLEQYNFYTPVNASSGNMIKAFRKMHEKTGNILYLVKAIELANNIVDVQNKETGHYPTYLVDHLLDQEGWINCMVYTAQQVSELDDYIKKRGVSMKIWE